MNTNTGRIFIALLIVALLGVVSYITYSNSKDSEEMQTSSEVKESASPTVVDLYGSSKFKVVSIVRNKFISEFSETSKKYDGLYMVIERKTDGFVNSSCGPYGAPTCYFFLESAWADTPPIEYIGSYTGGPGIDPDSLRFVDEYTLRFTASSGDGGGGVHEEWELDVRTGSTTRISSVHSGT